MTHVIDTIRPLHAFGQRKMVARVCIADRKSHIRAFLREELEETGFIVHECADLDQLRNLLTARMLDVAVLTLSAGTEFAVSALNAVAASGSGASVMLIGSPSPALDAVEEHGIDLGLMMLPALLTPYRVQDLQHRLRRFLPHETRPDPMINLEEALRCGWLQLWYEPKIDVRTMGLCGVEAVTRVCHPNCGVVSPLFLPMPQDPHFRALSEHVVVQAIGDWTYFLDNYSPVDLAISLPVPFLEDGATVERLQELMPVHPAFNGVLVQIKGAEMLRNLDTAREMARRLRFSNIAISVDDLGEEWPAFAELGNFPFVEVKVDARIVSGCAEDRLKRAACRTIVDLADRFGVRVVAKGVQTRADLSMAREIGFHVVQGDLFGRPMKARRFARKMLASLGSQAIEA